MNNFKYLAIAGAVALPALMPSASFAQIASNFPSKAVTLVVAATPGSGSDIIARILSPRLAERWGQAVIVENKTGASGSVGSSYVAKAKPDGHTILVMTNAFAVTPAVYKTVSYDPVADFAVVTKLADAQYVLAVNPGVPAKDIKSFIAYAKKNGGKINFATPGIGSPHQFGVELLKLRYGLDIVHVPYKGISGAVTELMGGQVPIMFTTVHSVLPYLRAGRLNALGVTGDTRSPIAPEISTFKEQGVDAMEGVDAWFGVAAPAHTPDDIITRLNRDFVAIVNFLEVKAELLKVGMTVRGTTPEQLAATVKTDMVRWKKMAADTRISLD